MELKMQMALHQQERTKEKENFNAKLKENEKFMKDL